MSQVLCSVNVLRRKSLLVWVLNKRIIFRSPTWWRFGLFSGSSLGFSELAYRLCTNFKCKVDNVNKDICSDFRGVKCVVLVYDRPNYKKCYAIFIANKLYKSYSTTFFLHVIYSYWQSQSTDFNMEISRATLGWAATAFFTEMYILGTDDWPFFHGKIILGDESSQSLLQYIINHSGKW